MMRLLIVPCLIVAGGLATAAPAVAEDDDAVLLERARRILREVPLIDGHNDVPWQYRSRVRNEVDGLDFAGDLSGLPRPMHTDLDRLEAGGVGGQFWSVFIPIRRSGGQPGDARVVLEQIDFVKRLAARHSDRLGMAYTADDIVRIHAEGRIACLIGMEGGHSIEDSMAVLRATAELGARYMSLTHSKNTAWADSATDEPEHDGLSDFGREVVREMNRVGVLVDLSHVSPATMHDALDASRAPVIFSHSSAFAVCRHPRNVPDDVLLRLRKNGGIVMITFLGLYVSEELRQYVDELERRRLEWQAEFEEPDDAERALAEWRRENPMPQATVQQVADHIDHVRDVAGIDHVGIGSDFDGTSSVPVGLEDVSTFPNLLVELMRRGYTDEELRKVVGRNLLRVLREAEGIANGLRHNETPSEHWLEGREGTR